MTGEEVVGPADELGPGTAKRAGRWAVGNVDGRRVALGGRCRHWGANMADGTFDRNGCLTCPWHGARYDVDSGRMLIGPRGVFERIPGYVPAVQWFGRHVPLERADVVERDGVVHVRDRGTRRGTGT